MKDNVMIKNLSSYPFLEAVHMMGYILDTHGIDNLTEAEQDTYDVFITYERGNYYDTLVIKDN